MALINCHECGREISDKAPACVHCGAPVISSSASDTGPSGERATATPQKKKSSRLSWLLLIMLLLIGVSIYQTDTSTTSGTAAGTPPTAEELRKQQIEEAFSAWDGSHIALVKWTKAQMNDPDSFEHDKTTYADGGDYLIVEMDFRGKNAFGGVVRQSAVAKVTLSGQILEAGID